MASYLDSHTAASYANRQSAENGTENTSATKWTVPVHSPPFYLSMPPPSYAQPEELEAFSIHGGTNFVFDGGKSQLKFYRAPPRNADLNKGVDKYVAGSPNFDNIDSILRCLQHRHARLSLPQPVHDQGDTFVCFRGLMTKILLTPFYPSDSWQCVAVRHGQTIYLVELETEEHKERERRMSDRDRTMCYWGYKFEQYCTVDTAEASHSPPQEGEFDGVASDCDQYCVMFKTRLADKRLLMVAEIDCAMPSSRSNHREYVELKTSRAITTERHTLSFERYKLLKFWAQCFTVGVPHVTVGFRDDNGIVQTVQTFSTRDLGRLARDKAQKDPCVCLAFANSVLAFVKTHAVLEAAQGSYVLSTCKETAQLTMALDTSENRIRLPDWFVSQS